MVALSDVFGVGTNINSPSYVDRGGLDDRFRRALKSSRHIVVHGGSKQGKSWLRTKMLPSDQCIVIQCTPSTTIDSLVREALGKLGVSAALKVVSGHEIQGTLDFSANVELGAKAVASFSAQARKGSSATSRSSTESEPIGKTPGDLSWVTATLISSNKRLVIEDFHYIDQKVKQEFAFLLKAMGEYGLYVIIVGIWPRDHLLTYFNGDLDGRVEDIHLEWSEAELRQVIDQGCEALGITLDAVVTSTLVKNAFSNVGLLQRLAEQLCKAEGIFESPGPVEPHVIDKGPSLDTSLRAVANEMQGRFENFADNFVRGMRRLPEGLEVYRHLLKAVTLADDIELQKGVDSRALLERINQSNEVKIRASALTQALERIDKLQARIGVNPPVLTYQNRRLQLVDPAFLFFRAHAEATWPWMRDDEITNDLAEEQPLDLNFD